MHPDEGENAFLREKKEKTPGTYLTYIVVLSVAVVFIGVFIFIALSLAGDKTERAETGIKQLETKIGATPGPGELSFSVSAAAVPAEKTTQAPQAPAIEVPPITREEPEEEDILWEEPEPIPQKTKKTAKPTKTPKNKKTAEPEEEVSFSAKSVLYEDGEEEEETPEFTDGEETPARTAKPTKTPKATKTPKPTKSPKTTATPEPTPSPTPAYKTLSQHDRSAEVTRLQERLMELGYLDIDEPTDYFGTVTENAVRLFQRQHGLTVDGTAGQETQTKLYADDAKKYCLSVGTEGGDVKMLQQQLSELGYMDADKIDSVYGDSTVRAVKSFQERNGLSSDGLAGEKTLEVLYSDEANVSYALYKKQKEAEASASAAAAQKKKATPKPTATPKKETRVDKFLEAARSKLGCEYILGDCGPKTFDCSGFVYWCLRQAGVSVTRLNAAGFSNKSGWKKITKLADLEAGDILFFRSEKSSHVNHCGIYIGGDKMIDASSANGKVIKRALSSYWKENFVCARRPW